VLLPVRLGDQNVVLKQ